MARSLVDRDRGYREMMRRVAAATKGAHVKVGIQGTEASAPKEGADTVIDLVTVAAIHEFGLGSAPERSFIRAWVDEHKPEIEHRLKALTQQVIARKLSMNQALEQFGAWAVGQIKQRIRDGIEPPLEPGTVRAKGSSTPLINTGQLWSSITSRVEAP